MKNTRSKKLLVYFLAALCLSVNSLNASANFDQFVSDLSFAYKFHGGYKLSEQMVLENLADDIKEFLYEIKNNKKNSISIRDNFIYLGERLYENLCEMKLHRSEHGWNSKFGDALGEVKSMETSTEASIVQFDRFKGSKSQDKVLENSPFYYDANVELLKVKWKSAYFNRNNMASKLKEWIKGSVLKLEGGKFSAWEKKGKLVGALTNLVNSEALAQALEDCKKEDNKSNSDTKENIISASDEFKDKSINNIDENKHGKLIHSWLSKDAKIEYFLYKDGHLLVKGNGKIEDAFCNASNNFDINPINDDLSNEEERIIDDAYDEDRLMISAKQRRIIKNRVKSISFEGNITSIDNKSFQGCKNLVSIVIPRSVTHIDDFAFAFTNLKSVQIPNGWQIPNLNYVFPSIN